jgi:hypothetical protein
MSNEKTNKVVLPLPGLPKIKSFWQLSTADMAGVVWELVCGFKELIKE